MSSYQQVQCQTYMYTHTFEFPLAQNIRLTATSPTPTKSIFFTYLSYIPSPNHQWTNKGSVCPSPQSIVP